MNLRDVTVKLGLGENDVDALRPGWKKAQGAMPDSPQSLSGPFLETACDELDVPAEIRPDVTRFGAHITGNAALKALFWYCHTFVFRDVAEPLDRVVQRWPSLDTLVAASTENARLFYLIVLLSGVPTMQTAHRAHAVPAPIVQSTLRSVRLHLRLRLENHRAQHGSWGFTPGFLYWSATSVRGESYRIDRLQFQFATFDHPIWVFRHRESKSVLALSDGGVSYLGDGLLAGKGRLPSDDTMAAGTRGAEFDRPDAGADRDQDDPSPGETLGSDASERWISDLTVSDTHITGHPILPMTGIVERQTVSLPRAEWRQELAPGDLTVAIHISAEGPLDFAQCGDAFRTALGFLKRHFPERPFTAFTCHSWLLDTQLQSLLPATSNMVRFQREMYLFPALTDDRHLLNQVFDEVPDDLSQAPRETTLQRAVIDRLRGGGSLRARAGGCFLLPEDLDWGAQVYLRRRGSIA